jgi:cytoskeleton protein RodZ
MASVGETLRAERLKRNLGLDQIASELKISSRFLEAIETGQFDKLPGGVFTRSFVRQYASLLGFDGEDLAEQVQRDLEPQPGVPQFAEKPHAVVSEFHVPKMEAWESVGESRFRWSGSLSAAALLVVALLICSAVYTWIYRPRSVESARVPPGVSKPPVARKPTALPPPGQNPALQPSPQSVATELRTEPQKAPQTPPPVAPASPGAAPPSAPPQPSNPVPKVKSANRIAAVRIEVTADEPVWLLGRVDGQFAFSGTLDAHQSRTVEATGKILLRFGNAGVVTVTLNGKPLGPMGAIGQVRTVQFTSGGFQIVPDKPPAALDRL